VVLDAFGKDARLIHIPNSKPSEVCDMVNGKPV